LAQYSFLQEHPWDPDWLLKGHPVEYYSQYHFNADTETLWPVLSDTSGINEQMGLSKIDFSESNGRRYGKSELGGRTHIWEEFPWQWEYGQYIYIERLYSAGWCLFVRVFIVLHENPTGGTDLTINFGWIPRDPFSALVLSIAGDGFMRRYGQAIDLLSGMQLGGRGDSSASGSAGFVVPVQKMALVTENPQIDAIAEGLRAKDLPSSDISVFIDYFKKGTPSDLYRMRPKILAKQLGIADQDLLRLMLNATRDGLLNMSWDLICPHCRGVRKSVEHLWDIPQSGACEVCQIEFDTTDIDSLEISFHPNPTIKKSEETLFCSAEPAKKSHILIQKVLNPGQDHRVVLAYPEGRYRMRLVGRKRFSWLDIKSGNSEQDA